jgi:hypothetical protein
MILVTHELVGAAIGEKINNPWLIIIFSLAMHFVLDTFRHGEYVESFDKKATFKNTWWKVALDFFIGIFIVSLLIYFNRFDMLQIKYILLGVFASIFPDSLTFLYWKFHSPYLKKIYDFHSWCHKYPHGAPERAWNLRNAANDIIISLIAILILFLK